MKSIVRVLLALAAVLIVAPSLHPPLAQSNPAEEEVWKMEEAYWRYAKALDLTSYRSLWHENFVGWPCAERKPVGKSKIGGWIQLRIDKGQTLRYELRREAVRDFKSVVVAHYAVLPVWVGKDGKPDGGQQWSRITHTWLKTGGKWQIITGMCAYEPEAGK